MKCQFYCLKAGRARKFAVMGVVIEWPGHGAVTVGEKVRGFALGMCPPRGMQGYTGRGWKDRLYADAIEALKKPWEPK